jgi:hypothetical protein
MNRLNRYLLVTAVLTVPALAQFPPDLDEKLAQAERQLQSLDLKMPGIDFAGIESKLAQLQAAPPFSGFMQRGGRDRDDAAYDSGARALDDHKYDDAVQRFDRVIAAKSARADGALYWKAYALNRLGRRDDAIAAVATLRRDYPSSRWLNDAQALEVEARQNSGQSVSPTDETNEDLKLMAINGLMNADPDRAVPLLEGILKGGSAPRVKDRAMFVLTQSHSPRAQQVLADYAKGSANPDLQMRAIRYIGMGGTADAQQQLSAIYGASTDVEVKKAILRSLFTAGASARLLDVARSEKDPALRVEAIRSVSLSRETQPSMLTTLYASDSDMRIKREIVDGLFHKGAAKELVDLARKETDPEMKKTIVRRLATMRNNKEAMDYMLELLK